MKNSEAVALLRWAADNNIGHHAFLQAGDVQLISTALERATPAQVRFGARLDELLGPDAARLFLMSVLGIVSAGMSSGRSMRLIEDEIEAELLTHLRSTDRSVLGAAADHAAVMATIADHLSHALMRMKRGEERPDHAGVLSPFHGSWHGPLWRRRWSGSPRSYDSYDQLGRKGHRAGINGGESGRE